MECWRVNLWFPGSCSSFIRSGCDNTPSYKHRSENKNAFLEEAISESRTLPGRPLRVAPCRAYFKPFNIFPPTPAGSVDIGWEAFMKAYELPSITALLHVCGGKSNLCERCEAWNLKRSLPPPPPPPPPLPPGPARRRL